MLIIEQIPAQSLFLYSKKEALHDIAKYDIPKTCSVIFLNYSKVSPDNSYLLDKTEIDAVWLALTHKIYTVNGCVSVPMKRVPVKLQPECVINLKN